MNRLLEIVVGDGVEQDKMDSHQLRVSNKVKEEPNECIELTNEFKVETTEAVEEGEFQNVVWMKSDEGCCAQNVKQENAETGEEEESFSLGSPSQQRRKESSKQTCDQPKPGVTTDAGGPSGSSSDSYTRCSRSAKEEGCAVYWYKGKMHSRTEERTRSSDVSVGSGKRSLPERGIKRCFRKSQRGFAGDADSTCDVQGGGVWSKSSLYAENQNTGCQQKTVLIPEVQEKAEIVNMSDDLHAEMNPVPSADSFQCHTADTSSLSFAGTANKSPSTDLPRKQAEPSSEITDDISSEDARSHTDQMGSDDAGCKTKFPDEAKIIRHLSIQSDEKPFECTICNVRFYDKSSVLQHVKIHTHHKPFECEICKRRFSQKSNLTVHMKIHAGEKSFECNVCSMKFCQKSSLHRHFKSHTNVKPYECSMCGKKFREKSHVIKHMTIHTGEKLFECSICRRKFARKDNLIMHKKIHTGVKPFECIVCSKTFCQKPNLLRHMIIHTGDKPYECNMCGRKFRDKFQLLKHIKLHISEEPFQCNVCRKKFSQKDDLVIHMETHSAEKPFGCILCLKKFSQKFNLNRHMKIHTGDNPYECTACDKKFRDRSRLKKHMKIHNREKPHEYTLGKI